MTLWSISHCCDVRRGAFFIRLLTIMCKTILSRLRRFNCTRYPSLKVDTVVLLMTIVCVLGTNTSTAGGSTRWTHLRDPTTPLDLVNEPEESALPEFLLQATFVQRQNRSAIINGKRLKMGQSVAGFVLVEIKDRYVELRQDHVSVKIFLHRADNNN